MENTKKIISPFPIELYYEDSSELNQFKDKNSPFGTSILERALEYVKFAIENNLDKILAFNIINLGIKIYLTKENYISVINHWADKYVDEENYAKCAELRELKKQLDETGIPLEKRPN